VVSLTHHALPAPALRDNDLAWLHLPVADFRPPEPDQIEAFLRFCSRCQEEGRAVAVHCTAGLGRTGTLLACWLVAEQGLEAGAAIDEVRRTRPGSIETPAQERSVFAFAQTRGGARGRPGHGPGRRLRRRPRGARVSPRPLPPAEDLRAWDRRHVWHPFTPHSVYPDESPLLIVAGEGNELIDADGRRYLDGVASLWCNVFGHRRPELDRAVREQLDRIAHTTFLGHAGAPGVELARRLAELAPAGLSRVFFSDDGSTAVEVALKMAWQHWRQRDGGRHTRRTRFLALDRAYHGDTLGAVSAGGIDLFHATFRPLLFDVLRAPSPHCYRCPLGLERATCDLACAERCEQAILEHGDELAAVIVEPGFQGAGGIIPLPPGLLPRIRAATERAGALLILDEVAAGFGRSAQTLFACQAEGVVPDVLCLGKGLTGGYLPLAATLASERVFEAFLGPPEDGRTFFHGHTYTGNALGAAAALATLDVFEQERVLEGLPAKARRLRQELERLEGLPGVGDVRGWGLSAGIELVADRAAKAPFPAAERRGMAVCREAIARGVFLRPLGDVIVLMPPLSITGAEIVRLVDAVEAGIAEACADGV